MKTLLVHPGTQHSFQLARQLQRYESLHRFWTGFAYDPESALGRQIGSLPASIQRRIAGRRLPGLPAAKLRTMPLTDLRALRRLRAGQNEQTVMYARNSAFQRRIPASELDSSDVVVGFDTASWILAKQALSLGRSFVLDRTIGHPSSFERLTAQLSREFPQWIEDCPRRFQQIHAAEEAEHELAERIVVGSSFARQTLIENGVPAAKIDIAPLGVDLDVFMPSPRPDPSRPLRFLFLGILGARKGVPLLLDVWRSLKTPSAELWLAGSIEERHARLIPELPGLRMLGKVGRRQLPDVLRQCDVLVFPSYFEGFGAVLLEAMAAGLPVIATDATGAPDVMTDGVEGYIIPTGDAGALRDAMLRFLDSSRDMGTMSDAARRCAERNSWDTFGARWMEILGQVYRAHEPACALAPVAVTSRNGHTSDAHLETPRQIKALLVHPGTQYSFGLARQLHKGGYLGRFWTGLAYLPKSAVGQSIRCLPAQIERRLSNRRIEGVPASQIRTRPLGEWRALKRLRAGVDEQRVMFDRNAAFQRRIPEQELALCNVLIGFDTSSWLLAERASARGCTFILDRSIGHPLSFHAILPTLKQQFQEWAEEVPDRLPELLRAEDIEHRLAKRIVVPSSFARRTLIENGVPGGKIVVIPFGVDLQAFRPGPRSVESRPLRFVFLGSLSARKGVPVLLEAWRSLAGSGAELWLVGSVAQGHARLIPPLAGLRLTGKIPHRELPTLLGECDVLVFPSYFEGLAQVQLEGLASGLPIIGTEASGATDLITDGQEGYIVPAGDSDALRDAMGKMISSSGNLAAMSTAARLRAENFSWDAYGDRWKDLLRQAV